MPRWNGTFEERFWNKVSITANDDECWEWTSFIRKNGYGFTRRKGDSKYENAHRVAWRLCNGDPGDLYVLHRCDNRKCVNPNHLFLGTHQDNMTDAKNKGKFIGRRCAQGSRLPQAKLKENQIFGVIEAYKSIRSYSEVGRMFGVNENTIRWIVLGKNWKSVTGGVSSI